MVREHTDKPECWCKPERFMVCLECRDHETPPADCWACGGRGLVEHSGDEDTDAIYVYQEENGT